MTYTLRNLLRDIKSHNTILFIGAGATKCQSMSLKHQLPDGKEMKYILYKDRYPDISDESSLEEQFRIDNKDNLIKANLDPSGYIPPEFVWEICFTKYKDDLTWYHRNIELMFCTGKYIPPSYKYLSWLHLDSSNKINHIITTNFDEKLEEAYKLLHHRGMFSNITVLSAAVDEDYPKLIIPSTETRIILKLHGTISKPYTIQSSLTEMSSLFKGKHDILNKIISENNLVVFIGYACNDKDIYSSLMEISKDIPRGHIKFRWVKRNQIEENSNIFKILKEIDPETKPEDNVLLMDGHECLLKIFESEIKTDKIDFSFIKEHTSLSFGKKIGDTGVSIEINEKEPIKDILHEKITFPKDEVNGIFKIINSFDMQRLRDIKQLSFAQYKFPCATHTRFSHSLGVAFLVGRALSENNNLNENALKIGKEAIANTIYAALLHDVGHGALGHVLDKFYDRHGQANEHENYTKQFIEEGLYDLSKVLRGVHLNHEFIQDLITFKLDEPALKNPERIFLSWLITDNGLDLDRLDFLMRDRLMTNCDFSSQTSLILSDEREGLKDRGYLYKIIDSYISRLKVADKDQIAEEYQDNFPDGAKILYVDDDGKRDTDHLLSYLLELYTHMYRNVYYHDRVAAAEAMMAKALSIAFCSGDIDRSLFYIFTDSELFSYLEKLENDLIRELVYSVKMRRLFKPIISITLVDLDPSITACKIEETIEKSLNLDPTDFNSVVIVNLPRKKRLKNLYVKQGKEITLYSKLSHFDKELAKIEGKIFVNPNSEIFTNNKMKEKILNLLKQMDIEASLIVNERPKKPPKKMSKKTKLIHTTEI